MSFQETPQLEELYSGHLLHVQTHGCIRTIDMFKKQIRLAFPPRSVLREILDGTRDVVLSQQIRINDLQYMLTSAETERDELAGELQDARDTIQYIKEQAL